MSVYVLLELAIEGQLEIWSLLVIFQIILPLLHLSNNLLVCFSPHLQLHVLSEGILYDG
jgi:hypothetical protein